MTDETPATEAADYAPIGVPLDAPTVPADARDDAALAGVLTPEPEPPA